MHPCTLLAPKRPICMRCAGLVLMASQEDAERAVAEVKEVGAHLRLLGQGARRKSFIAVLVLSAGLELWHLDTLAKCRGHIRNMRRLLRWQELWQVGCLLMGKLLELLQGGQEAAYLCCASRHALGAGILPS